MTRLCQFSSSALLFFAIGCWNPNSKEVRQTDTRYPTPRNEMAFIEGGTFAMGSESGNPDESPIRFINITSFYLDKTEVTNEQFARFVKETAYVTVAERKIDSKDFPTVPLENLKPGAAAFTIGKGWSFVYGANWRHPAGPVSTITGKDQHPVVQVAWEDAKAFAKWAGKRLPTESEWEYAARAKQPDSVAGWGKAPFDNKHPQANIWQGDFPATNDNTDGYMFTAPVGSFPPNPYGLYDIAGNVWEWCEDWYRPDAYLHDSAKFPHGPTDSFDPEEPNVPKRVMRGGSFLCADCYCKGYRITARMKSSPDTGLFHVGFRCAKDIP